MKKKFKNNYKYLLGLIIGFAVSTVIGYAVVNNIIGAAEEVSYDDSNSWITAPTVQDALDRLYQQKNCPLGYACTKKKSTLAIGDYIRYTPSLTEFSTDPTKTGYETTNNNGFVPRVQTIYPKELDMWRVIAINQDGTVDIISENVSSTNIYFSSQVGYQNLVGYLNELASKYENSTYTVGSRHFGYNGQTEYITDTSKFTNPAPWTCSTGGSCDPDPDDNESLGGGDELYLNDYNLVNGVLGTRVAKNSSGTNTAYWMASRYYYYNVASNYNWHGRLVNVSGNASSNSLYDYGNGFNHNSRSYALRPIVTLKSGLTYLGLGTSDNPMEIQ